MQSKTFIEKSVIAPKEWQPTWREFRKEVPGLAYLIEGIVGLGLLVVSLVGTLMVTDHIKEQNSARSSANAVLDTLDQDFWAIEKTPEISVPEQDRAPIVRALTTLCGDLTIVHRGGLVSNKCDTGLPDYASMVADVKSDNLVRYAKSATEKKVWYIRDTYSSVRQHPYETPYVPLSAEDVSQLKTEEAQVSDLRKALEAATPSNQSYGGRMTTVTKALLP